MPAPYPLIVIPPGSFENMFDFPAINMAAAHNMFIQGVNAMAAHAPLVEGDKVAPFVFFSLTVLETIHHHHRLEETVYFDMLEKNLGPGYLAATKEQHDTFVPQIEETESWLQEVRDGKQVYDGTKMLSYIGAFSEKMIEHLNQEVEKLDRDVLRQHFTEKELKDIDTAFMKVALKDINFYTSLPFAAVCADPATPWFPPLPTPLKWATRFWFSRRHRDAWQFGPMDLAGNPKALPSISA
ncbi:hypothetical protein CPB83DRAFT_862022 [Crepidotus variabilis]|uniref:Hemerythrin-like domain-containing protein n=1 Tax=Crepidotus variabilis TaxID=179855 RepID=A0A9P6E7L8_9AGAR|nr:hypothetical protein CPB83DRAFT_862022 [Crepidotus variabilis]